MRVSGSTPAAAASPCRWCCGSTLRSAERLKALAYARLSAPEGEREALGEDLVAVRELVLLPGKSYALALKMPGETSTIGVTGLFRAPTPTAGSSPSMPASPPTAAS
jgi:predicted component of type VI protein secretion system